MDRCPTGITGFDKLCHGGFVRNSDNIIVGGPGSGKTTFLLQFLWNGVTQFGENGLYCSFEPDIVDTINDAIAHGWDFARLSEEGSMKFLRFAPQTSIEELKSELTKIISKNDIRRVCFDPVSILALNQSDVGKMRQTIFELSSLMKRLRVTTVFADEFLESEWTQQLQGDLTKTDILRFLSDSVTILYDSGVSGVGDRALRISKMRRTNHERRVVGMQIENKGVKVFDIDEQEEDEEDFNLTPLQNNQEQEIGHEENYYNPNVEITPKPFYNQVEQQNQGIQRQSVVNVSQRTKQVQMPQNNVPSNYQNQNYGQVQMPQNNPNKSNVSANTNYQNQNNPSQMVHEDNLEGYPKRTFRTTPHSNIVG